jgi:hypothetical protein
MTNTKNASYDISSETDKLHKVEYQNPQSGTVCSVADVLLIKPTSLYTEGILNDS